MESPEHKVPGFSSYCAFRYDEHIYRSSENSVIGKLEQGRIGLELYKNFLRFITRKLLDGGNPVAEFLQRS